MMGDANARAELERQLKAAEAELEEVEEMRSAILGQTGVHIGARELQKHYARFDADQKRWTERVAQLRAQLTTLETSATE
ncbi:MAG: hypothetical protein HZB51_28945 [Chloroflexi bacterium]|nr:hypothetical protein [Chloroflexota bacterium]